MGSGVGSLCLGEPPAVQPNRRCDIFERQPIMKVRKVAAVAGLTTGAAIAFGPLASAAPTDLIDFDTINAGQISTLNSLFEFGAQLTGVPDSAYDTYGGFLAINPSDVAEFAPKLVDPADAAQLTGLEYYLYGVDPIEAGISSQSGAYNVLNGAAIQFADSYNATLYGLLNPNEVAPADIFIGSDGNVAAALMSDNPAVWFYDRGIDDLSGYFQQDLSFLQVPLGDAMPGAADPVDLSSTFTAEIEGLNGVFGSIADAAGLSDKVIDGTGALPWDTIATADTTDYFNTLVFGFNPDNITDGPIGSYDVFNGALTEFANAYNVGLFALLNGGDLIDAGDIFGPHVEFLEGGVTSAITDFLQLGFSDILGYFDLSAVMPTM